jgi:hypothetical protein
MSITQAEKDEWVAALRSGEYRQGFGKYRNGKIRSVFGWQVKEKFCSLGVFMDIFDKLPGIPFDEQCVIMDNNDLRHYTFEESAAWIEGNVDADG